MTDIAITEARNHLATIVDTAHREHEPVFLTRRGIRVAAVIDSAELERLREAAEELEDIRAVDLAWEEMEQTGQTPIPWEDVKRDLGLT
ncbi:type II toxin-antitoxin system Phd/YefM family antitoxin [Arthrobacter sp. MMS18-M83]|uniref:type II toxin-antitoxin system Phd/YefM family antitoxin n=1 Tax=Arthrobacter sp. MMS18-M83 TaxID=2996261 RepID=UPI00227AF8ED|nr:type II toxin-antitoxin system Phd/YefM family antitoxin [Arthrobacter sp. MMS18-M83]WAH98325.1 type II toxin-antitoxin system Phd/YefM family antitoxin [Arthrobacter sp. MMS18-M83]